MMHKLVYLLWAREKRAPSELRRVLLEECAPKMLEARIAGLQMNIADDLATTPSPSPKPLFSEPFVAQVNLWVQDMQHRHLHEDLLRKAGFELAGYRVDEWLYTDYGDNRWERRRDWADGQRSPGILAITVLERPQRIPKDEWMRRWFGWQSPMSEWMQPRSRYVRNLIEEVLTPGAFAYDGIVEEGWPSGEVVTNKLKFFGAKNYFELMKNMFIMLRSVTRILRLWKITTVMTSEYFLKTPTIPKGGAGQIGP